MMRRRVPAPVFPYTELIGRIQDLVPAGRRNYEPRTTLADIEEKSGPLYVVKPHDRRFVLLAVSGFTIQPGAGHVSSGHSVTTTWSVLDSLDAYLEVARFYPDGGDARYKAQVEVDRLNALDVRESL